MIKLILSLILFSALSVNAQDTAKPAQPPEWLKYGQPGDAHKKTLEMLVGNFTYTSKMWMEPNEKPEESSGTSESKWILDGRFVQEDVKGKTMGQDFVGTSITGYDNFAGEYQTIWMDNMSTAIMHLKGANPGVTKVIKQEGTGSNPFKNEKNYWMRSELKIKNKNEHTYTMYSKDSNGKEFKCLEMVYKRK